MFEELNSILPNIILVGLNHNTAPVEIREKIVYSGAKLQRAIEEIKKINLLSEKLIFSTCNRTEIYAVANDSNNAAEEIEKFLQSHIENNIELKPYLYKYINDEVVKHLFSVSSGINSMVIGENQILHQVKEAFERSQEKKSIGPVLNNLFRRAIYAGRRARTETDIGAGITSVGQAAVELARRIFDELKEKSILIIGSGKMSSLCAKHLVDSDASFVFVANRTYDKAVSMAEAFNGRAIRFESIFDQMKTVDIVISSTGAPHFILKKEDIAKIMKIRKGQPIFLIDIAVPRDIEPDVEKIDNVFLYNIDDLKTVVSSYAKEREKEVVRVTLIVNQEVDEFMKWYNSLSVKPIIKSLQKKFEDIRINELQKTLNKLPEISDKEKDLINNLTVSMMNKLIADPLISIKEWANDKDKLSYLETLRNLFRLNCQDTEDKI